MQRNYNSGIINRCGTSNALYIRLINTSSAPNSVSLKIYDYTDSTPKIVYETTLYLNGKSIKAMTFPLVAQDYDDCFNVLSYQICYTTSNHFIRLSYKELHVN